MAVLEEALLYDKQQIETAVLSMRVRAVSAIAQCLLDESANHYIREQILELPL